MLGLTIHRIASIETRQMKLRGDKAWGSARKAGWLAANTHSEPLSERTLFYFLTLPAPVLHNMVSRIGPCI
jgi:hypothetical protein